jgi:hypothetical protein
MIEPTKKLNRSELEALRKLREQLKEQRQVKSAAQSQAETRPA